MGFDYHGVRLLTYISKTGYKITDTAMLGRQYLHTDETGIKKILYEAELKHTEKDITTIVKMGRGYSENLLQFLGARNIHSFDYSDYEEPTFVHDFNEPISLEFDEKYDLVVDGGSLEHIFNYPIAIQSCLRMVKVGGLFATITPCNNICGHGFYQFSPELYFSLLCKNNGFSLIKLFIYENNFDPQWYEVTNPRDFGNRVNLTTKRSVMMLVIGKKTAPTPSKLTLQQSDYELLWSGRCLKEESSLVNEITCIAGVRHLLGKLFSAGCKVRIRRLLEPSPFDPRLFSKAKIFGDTEKTLC